MLADDELKSIVQAVTWVLVFLGWWFTHVNAAARDRRKEALDSVRNLEKAVWALATEAQKYYLSPPSPEAEVEGARIKQQIKRIRMLIDLLKQGRKSGFDLKSEVIWFNGAVTGDPFESAGRQTLTVNDQKLLNIQHSADQLVAAAYTEFERVHSTRFRGW